MTLTDSFQFYSTVYWNVSVTDNSGTVNADCTRQSGNRFNATWPIKPQNITCTAEDQYGNAALCFFSVTVYDEENPEIMCPSDFNVTTDAGLPTSFINWTVSYTDNTDDLYDVTVTGSGASYNQSGEAFPIGTTTLKYTVTDVFGNNESCTFMVIVKDKEPPVPSCPSLVTGVTDEGKPNGTVSYNLNVTDNVQVAMFSTNYTDIDPDNIIIDNASAVFDTTGVFMVGETIIEYVFTDNGSPTGNEATCYVTIQIEDQEKPEIIDCPMDITVNTTNGEPVAVNVTWTEPTATDNSGETPEPESDYTSGDNMFVIGGTTVQYNASDSSGNFNDRCSFTVTVEDNEPPGITCPTNVTSNNYIDESFGIVQVSTDEGSPNATVTWDQSVTSDNSNENVTVVSSPYQSGDMIPIEISSIVIFLMATDPYGNEGTCEFVIQVQGKSYMVFK
ncbi:hyalin-like [Anneissia japonica]|uniref:hyalin-like n=1 Tax=Anneissia japonica TaxID=1529436 RepID=UPI001425760B|nr:hyalin-like [Anneissia japonica]